jgi:hypothetical protein
MGYTGTWNPAVEGTSATCTFTPTAVAGQCASITTLAVLVNPSPTDVEVIVSSVSKTSQGVIEITNVTNGVSPFYSVNNGSFSSTTTTLIYFLATSQLREDANGCEYEKL